MDTYTTPDGTVLPDDGHRYALTGPRGVDPFLDALSPHADHHTISVYGSADLARRMAAAHEAGVSVAFQRLDTDAPDDAEVDEA